MRQPEFVYDLWSDYPSPLRALTAEADGRPGDLAPHAALRRLVRRQHAGLHGEFSPPYFHL